MDETGQIPYWADESKENPPEDVRPYAKTATKVLGKRGPLIVSPSDLVKFLEPHLKDTDREYVLSVILDTAHQVIAVDVVAKGILDSALIHPREIFKAAINRSAKAIILVHNHPSGNPHPSNEDREVFNRMKDAGKILGISVLDSIIMGEGRHYSFMENANV